MLAVVGGIEKPTKWGLYDRDAFEHWTDGRICLLGDAAHPTLPTMSQAATPSFEDGAALSTAFQPHREDAYSALLHYERVRHYRATRFQFGSKFLFKHLEPDDSSARRAILATVDERDYPFFSHEQRACNDMNWIYAFDARNIGDKLPARKLGPWDFRSRSGSLQTRKDIAQNLWLLPVSLKGDRKITREGSGAARQLRGLLDHHPRQGLRLQPAEGPPPRWALRGAHVRRQRRDSEVRRLPLQACGEAHGAFLRRRTGLAVICPEVAVPWSDPSRMSADARCLRCSRAYSPAPGGWDKVARVLLAGRGDR
ncbi:FAD-dependent monooxygenase [Panacagrimonas perspica]|nr:FAD-dependent monooxygenase [Panacagrimonas perspica]